MTGPTTGDRGPGTGNDLRSSPEAPPAGRRPDLGYRSADPGVGGRKRVAVVVFPGSNRDRDAMAAVAAVGGEPVPVWHQSQDLAGCGAVILPGGFSYGDYLRAGAMAAHSPVMRTVRAHAGAGGAVLGICNGFQMLLEIGLLPGAMLMNRTLRFIHREVHLRVERDDLALLATLRRGQVLRLPVAHKEGNWFAEPEMVEQVERRGSVALRYCSPDGELAAEGNPNGALRAIAGLINAEGNVLGMMPHPECYLDPLVGGGDGAAIIRAVVDAA